MCLAKKVKNCKVKFHLWPKCSQENTEGIDNSSIVLNIIIKCGITFFLLESKDEAQKLKLIQ